jgi:transketolase N-terminal domain/subunit
VSEGWRAEEVDGRNHEALEKALARPEGGRPTAVVAAIGKELSRAA